MCGIVGAVNVSRSARPVVGKVIRKRNRETAMKGKISRKCSTEGG